MHSHYIHTHEAKTNRDRKEMKKLILGAVDTGSVSIFSANHHKTHTHTPTLIHWLCWHLCLLPFWYALRKKDKHRSLSGPVSLCSNLGDRQREIPEGVEDSGAETTVAAGQRALQLSHKQVWRSTDQRVHQRNRWESLSSFSFPFNHVLFMSCLCKVNFHVGDK